MDHFRVAFSLSFEASLTAKFLLRNSHLLIIIIDTLHVDSPLNRGNGLLQLWRITVHYLQSQQRHGSTGAKLIALRFSRSNSLHTRAFPLSKRSPTAIVPLKISLDDENPKKYITPGLQPFSVFLFQFSDHSVLIKSYICLSCRHSRS